MQCKDIPTKPILNFLLQHQGEWCNWRFNDEKDVRQVIGFDLPDKLVLAKMRNLILKGLVSGCGCGCRGDFEITDKGIKQLQSSSPNSCGRIFSSSHKA